MFDPVGTVFDPVGSDVSDRRARASYDNGAPQKSEADAGQVPSIRPHDGETHVRDIVIAPLVGVDEQLYRLGNGGGYYDRTLARVEPVPRNIGVGFHNCLPPTIYPMSCDVAMSEVLLSDGTYLTREPSWLRACQIRKNTSVSVAPMATIKARRNSVCFIRRACRAPM